jgi:hypothetical protein
MEVSVDRRQIAIHEASHAVVARLFKDFLELDFITLSNEKLTNQQSLGAISVRLIANGSPDAYSAIGIVWLAGIVGDKIRADGEKAVAIEKEAILNDLSLMDWKLAGKDAPEFTNNANFIELIYGSDFKKYQKFCINYLIDFLADPEVWDFVKKLSDLLLSKTDSTLTKEELSDFFHSSGFDEFMEKRQGLLINRLNTMRSECAPDDPYQNLDSDFSSCP